MNTVTVCALFYGNHPALAQRLLDSIGGERCNPDVVKEFRIGLNEVSKATNTVLSTFVRRTKVPVRVYVPEKNVGKYPLMRRMFFDPRVPIRTHWIQWWDDDSYLVTDDPKRWWQNVAELKGDLIGQCWFRSFVGRQADAIKAQPWYTGQPFYSKRNDGKPSFRFATGGWWMIPTEFVRRWDYPFLDLHHNGGDIMLSELVRQQQKIFLPYDKGVRINWGLGTRISPRRGIGKGNTERLLWKDWEPGKKYDHSIHEFACKVLVNASHEGVQDVAKNGNAER